MTSLCQMFTIKQLYFWNRFLFLKDLLKYQNCFQKSCICITSSVSKMGQQIIKVSQLSLKLMGILFSQGFLKPFFLVFYLRNHFLKVSFCMHASNRLQEEGGGGNVSFNPHDLTTYTPNYN